MEHDFTATRAGGSVPGFLQTVGSEPEMLATLSAQDLQSSVSREDDDICLIVHDGETGYEISTAIGGKARAVRGLQRLAATAASLAAELNSVAPHN